MSAIVLIVGFSVWGVAKELVPLFKKGFVKDAMLYLTMLVIGGVLSVCTIQLIDLPSPMVLLKVVYGPLLKWFAPE